MVELLNTILSKIITFGTAIVISLGIIIPQERNHPDPTAFSPHPSTLEQNIPSITSEEKGVSPAEERKIKNQEEQRAESHGNTKQNPLVSKPQPSQPEITLPKQQNPPKAEAVPLIETEVLNRKVREAIVNIYCLSRSEGLLKPISGSGIVIDSRGIVLTNAHIAQYFLLENYKTEGLIECIIRTGNPAKAAYAAEPIYISPRWIEKNAEKIKQQRPQGTGENDYALLYITDAIPSGVQKPAQFASTSIGNRAVKEKEPVLVATYPAGFIDGIDVARNLWLVSSTAEIEKIYTFRESGAATSDLFSLGGVIVAQEGASGGAVVSLESGKLIGIIVTSTLDGTTSERDLRALSVSHIAESFKNQSGITLPQFLEENLEEKARSFRETIAPALTKLLEKELEK